MKWSEEDIAWFKENYPTTLNRVMAEKLGRSYSAIRNRAQSQGLLKSPEHYEKVLAENQFKQGRVPATKGKKQHEYMSPEAIERTKATRFKKGQKPHNTAKRDGEIRIRKDQGGRYYNFIRIKKGKWLHLHVHLWKKANGKIPPGHVVRFKDGNSLNCVIENLELITKAENLNRNYHDYPEEYKQAVRRLSLLNKRIKKLEDGKE